MLLCLIVGCKEIEGYNGIGLEHYLGVWQHSFFPIFSPLNYEIIVDIRDVYMLGDQEVNANLYCNSRTSVL